MYMPVKIKGTNEIGYISDMHPLLTCVQVLTEADELKEIYPSDLRKINEWIHGSRLIPPYDIDVLILTLDYDGDKVVTQGVYCGEKHKFYIPHLCWIKEAYEVYWKPLPDISKYCIFKEIKKREDNQCTTSKK